MSRYRLKPGVPLNIDAQAVGERFELIRARFGGQLTPEAVVEDARPEDAPTHPYITWDRDLAVAKCWRSEAQLLIRIIELDDQPVSTEEGGETDDEPPLVDDAYGVHPLLSNVRAFMAVQAEDGTPYYSHTYAVLSDAELRQQALNRLIRELRAMQHKCRAWTPVFTAVGLAVEEAESLLAPQSIAA